MPLPVILPSFPPIEAPAISPSQLPATPATIGGAPSFRAVLEQTIDHVEQSRTGAKAMAESFMAGGNEELHSVAMSAQRAELEFDLLLQIRNKVVSAYQEIMRMQV